MTEITIAIPALSLEVYFVIIYAAGWLLTAMAFWRWVRPPSLPFNDGPDVADHAVHFLAGTAVGLAWPLLVPGLLIYRIARCGKRGA